MLRPRKRRRRVPPAAAPWHGPAMATGSGAALLSIAMIAAFLLGAGGVWLIARRRDPRKGLLMLVAALVVLGNVLVWTV